MRKIFPFVEHQGNISIISIAPSEITAIEEMGPNKIYPNMSFIKV